MANATPRYGSINVEMVSTWFHRTPEDDPPFWALNLMQYRTVADYGADGGPAVSGREADERYTPRESLAAVGAVIAFAADVDATLAGSPAWDRIGIVRYPSRRAFLEMQQRDDFQRQHVHKDAGMQFTIVMATFPDGDVGAITSDAPGTTVLRVVRGDAEAPDGVERLATFGVEGVIVGDERRWDRVVFERVVDDARLDALTRSEGSDEALAVAITPFLDDLAATVAESRAAGVIA
ncbi:MAG TPA: hypothetical protein VFZ83_11725 [Acidimicrobiia bacterium]|nr:hypothetical protein [Acidimicrobiia bacterium]